ncbi:MAG TPA: hypothetical protein VFY78_06735 [Gammaproteobacteria bacterium]|nr:hypothetical protein [Gammaproteobacteria bacterium]
MNKYMLLFFFCLPAALLADTDFNHFFNANIEQHKAVADRIATYHSTDIALDIQLQQTELEALQQSVETLTQTAPAEPLYWFISGLNHNNLAALFSAQKNETATSRHIEQRNLAYRKAMQLDQTPPLKLSAAIYATMKTGLPEADKIKAIESEIKQGGSGESDDQYIQLHWSRVHALEKSGRHDEAQQALAEMQREISRLELNNPDYQIIVERAQDEINQGRAAEKQPAPKPQAQTKPDNSALPSKPMNKNLLWVIFFGALVVISLWMIVRAWRSK